jgi:hypothetical protein
LNIRHRRRPRLDTPSVFMSLLQTPISYEGSAAVADVADHLAKLSSKKRLVPNQVVALGAIIADLLRSMAYKPARPCARSQNANGFLGERIGYRPFKAVFSALNNAGMVEVKKGYLDRARGEGRVTRILPTERLLDCLAAYRITPANRDDHFGRQPGERLVACPIQRRAASTFDSKHRKKQGVRMPVNLGTPALVVMGARVTAINEYLEQQAYEGMTFDGLFRGFNNGDDPAFDWNKGGRLYAVGGSYQSLRKSERKLIRINGEPTTEVDIGASHLTILHALMSEPLPNRPDFYDVPGIERDAVKRFVTASLGAGKPIERWSWQTANDYADDFHDGLIKPDYTGNIRRDHPIEMVRQVVLRSIPILEDLTRCGYKWDDLQFEESEIIFSSVERLMTKNIPALPLHDSLICPSSKKDEVREVLYQLFIENLTIIPVIKYK